MAHEWDVELNTGRDHDCKQPCIILSLSYKLRCYTRISTPEKSCNNTREKNSPLLTRKAIFINEWKEMNRESPNNNRMVRWRKLSRCKNALNHWLYQTREKISYFFHVCCCGFSQGWKYLYNTVVYMINSNFSDRGHCLTVVGHLRVSMTPRAISAGVLRSW